LVRRGYRQEDEKTGKDENAKQDGKGPVTSPDGSPQRDSFFLSFRVFALSRFLVLFGSFSPLP
jgi:hypothetical protein